MISILQQYSMPKWSKLEEMAQEMQFLSSHMEDKLEEKRVEMDLKERRVRRRKRMAVEVADEERNLDALMEFNFCK